MSNEAKKTEHSGAKKGQGAFWGKKKDAKLQSNRLRRETGKELANEFDEIKHEQFLIHEALDRTYIQIQALELAHCGRWDSYSLARAAFSPTTICLSPER